MIKIYPTNSSGLSASSYSLDIKKGTIYPVRERPQRVRTTLSNNAVVTPWKKSQVGAVQTIEVRLTAAEFAKLRAIVEHETVFNWAVASLSRNYVCTIDIMEITPLEIGGAINFQVQLKFTITEVLN